MLFTSHLWRSPLQAESSISGYYRPKTPQWNKMEFVIKSLLRIYPAFIWDLHSLSMFRMWLACHTSCGFPLSPFFGRHVTEVFVNRIREKTFFYPYKFLGPQRIFFLDHVPHLYQTAFFPASAHLCPYLQWSKIWWRPFSLTLMRYPEDSDSR